MNDKGYLLYNNLKRILKSYKDKINILDVKK